MTSRKTAIRPFAIAIALAVLAGVIYLLREGASGESTAIERVTVDRTGEVHAPTIEPRPEVEVVREEERAEPRATAETLIGRFVDPLAAAASGPRVRLSRSPPVFVSLDPMAGAAQNELAPEAASIDRIETGNDGSFVLHGDRLVGYLEPEDPFVVARNAVYADARESTQAPPLVIEPAGVIRGSVRGPDGRAIAGAKVRIQSRVGLDVAFVRNPIRKTAETTTDADGSFRVEHVPSDLEFDLAVEAESLLASWRPIRVGARETQEIAIELAAGTTLSGQVRLVDGTPVAGAKVHVSEAIMRVDPRAPSRADVGSLTVASDADGKFAIHGLTPGRYVASATHPDYVRASLRPFDVPAEGLDLREELVLFEGPRIRGRVIDASGKGIEGATVAVRMASALMANGLGLTPDSAEQMGGRRFDAAKDGGFESPPLEDGAYDLVAVAPGYKKGFLTQVRAGSDGISVALLENGGIEGTVIALEQAEPVLQFHVAALRPFAFAKLTDPETFEPVKHASVLSNKGKFRLDDLSPGTYDVSVTAEGLARATIEDVVVAEGKTTRAINFFLRPEAVIAGTITEEGTNRPIAGARVTTRQGLDAMQPDPLAAESEAQSDAKGRFELRGLGAGRFTLSATARGLAPATIGPIEVEEGRRIEDVSIVLSRGGVIRGRVLDARSTPVTGAMISASRVGMMSPNMTVTDGNGDYRLEGLPSGMYTVTKMAAFSIGTKDAAADMLRGMMTKSARVENGAELVLDFQEESDGTVKLTGVVRVDGRPASGVLLHFVPDDSDDTEPIDDDGESGKTMKFQMTTSDSAGRYSIDTLSPGNWSVVVQSSVDMSAASRQTFELELTPAVEQTRDFSLSRTGVEGVVLRRGDRAPVGGARVSIDALDEGDGVDPYAKRIGSRRAADLFADSKGHFRASGLAPGRYRIVAGGTGVLNLGGGNYARSAPREVTLAEGQVIDGIEFELEPGASIRGTVIANGRGVEGAAMFFVRDGDTKAFDPFSTTLTDGSGGFLADGLDPGTYTVGTKAPGYAPSWERGVVVRQNETTTIDLSVVEGTPFEVVVVDGEGQDVTASCSVRITTVDGLDVSEMRSLQDFMEMAIGSTGRPAIRLASGEYAIVVRRGEQAKTQRVTHGSVTRHVVTLE